MTTPCPSCGSDKTYTESASAVQLKIFRGADRVEFTATYCGGCHKRRFDLELEEDDEEE